MKQSKTFASGFPVEETIESLRQQLAEKDAEIERLEEERDDALQGPWAEWAERSLKIIREHTGYDGYDDQSNGVDLPNELSEAFNELEAEEERLRQQLAASQAREQLANECRIALVHQIHELADHIERAEYCITDIDMLKQMRGQRAYAMKVASQWNQNGNPFSADTAALEALIAKAGEVMRERCRKVAFDMAYADSMAVDVSQTIRAIPGVTLKDIK